MLMSVGIFSMFCVLMGRGLCREDGGVGVLIYVRGVVDLLIISCIVFYYEWYFYFFLLSVIF